MNNDIAPKLEKLKKEKADFLAFQKIEGEVERLRRLLVAYDYMRNKDKLDRSEADLNEKLNARDALEHRLEQLAADLKDIQADVDTIMRRKEAELQKGNKYQELQKEVTNLSNQLTRLNTQRGLLLTSMGEEGKKLAETECSLKQSTSKAQDYQKVAEKLEAAYAKLKKSVGESTDKVKQQEELLQTLSTGISAKEGAGNSFVDQIEGNIVISFCSSYIYHIC
jgi:structural maintenance of chromosome 2